MQPGTLAIRRDAPRQRRELDEHSWVDVYEGFVSDPQERLDEFLGGVAWVQSEVLRYDRYVPEQRLGAGLSSESHPLLRQTELWLRGTYTVRPDGVAALLYRTGEDFQGMHSDRQLRWLDDTLIAIVVLGERRPFVLRPRGDWRAAGARRTRAGTGPDDIVYTPGAGDLLVMGGACQRDWLHGVPAAPTGRPRVSLTWRWTARRGQPDTAPSYYDGFQYSDRPRQPGTRTRPA